jgi:hypothetical protein
MWRFSSIDELRHDHLIGLSLEADQPAPTSPTQRRYLLAAAARYCRWRDGTDSRKTHLSRLDADHVERRMLRDLVPLDTLARAPDRIA